MDWGGKAGAEWAAGVRRVWDATSRRASSLLLLEHRGRGILTLRRFIAATIFSIAIPAGAWAAFDSGNDLYKFCTANDAFNKGMCLGPVTGFFENLQLAYQFKNLSTEITRGQLVDVVMKELRTNPADRHMPAYLIASGSLIKAFNCESWVGSGPAKR